MARPNHRPELGITQGDDGRWYRPGREVQVLVTGPEDASLLYVAFDRRCDACVARAPHSVAYHRGRVSTAGVTIRRHVGEDGTVQLTALDEPFYADDAQLSLEEQYGWTLSPSGRRTPRVRR